MPRLPLTLWTLTEHESIHGSVVGRPVVLTDQERKIKAACGVLYPTNYIADEAAEEINEKYAVPGGFIPDLTNAAHMAGFTNDVKIEGHRLYIPIKAPEGAVQ